MSKILHAAAADNDDRLLQYFDIFFKNSQAKNILFHQACLHMQWCLVLQNTYPSISSCSIISFTCELTYFSAGLVLFVSIIHAAAL